MEVIFLKTEKNKANKPHKFALNFPQRLSLKISIKHASLQNLSIHYTWTNIRKY